MLVLLTVACGRERPTFEPLPDPTGRVAVESTPAGARIELDGVDTGLLTPQTFEGLRVGRHVVRLSLDGFAVSPESLVVDVDATTLAAANFTLVEVQQAPVKVVLLESFSNASCVGCPENSQVIDALMHTEGYGRDRLVSIKFSMSWPLPTDPHHLDRKSYNDDRAFYYQQTALNVGIPTVVLDGALAGASGSPPGLEDLRSGVDLLLAADPGFAVEIEADTGASPFDATVTLRAVRDIDLSDCVLRVALVEDTATHASAPGNQGETEFHWPLRDLAVVADLPAVLAADSPLLRTVSLARNSVDWTEGALHVVAFVQRETDLSILQSGSTSGP